MPRPTSYAEAIERALAGTAARAILLPECASTNDEARALARDGAEHLTVVVAEHQTAGRGRLARTWTSEPGAGLLMSVILRPTLPVERWTLLPLLTGVAAARAIRHRARVPAALKWPNDLMVETRKLGGILVEAEPPAFAVAGLGINVSQTTFPPELAGTADGGFGNSATSLACEESVRLDRADLLGWTLRYLAEALDDPEGSLDRYRRMSATLGRQVRIEQQGRDLRGLAQDIDARGALLVQTAGGVEIVTAGDVVHIRADLPRG